MQDRPTAAELLRAAREFCENELMPELAGRKRFHTRVLANVLGILEREWEGEEDALRNEWTRLAALLGQDPALPGSHTELAARVREANVELGTRIRAGAMDDRFGETLAALKETVREKLAIANPNYSEGASAAGARSTR